MDNKDKQQASSKEVTTKSEPTPTKRLVSGARRVFAVVRNVGNELLPIDEKIPEKDINTPTVARIIDRHVSHPMNERRGFKPEDIPLDITDVLTQMGYIAPWHNSDYRKRFPEAYFQTRRALSDICKLEALTAEFDDNETSHGERTFYRVSDLQRLRQIANSQTDKKH